MSEWRECKLGSICSIKGGKRLPKGTNLVTTRNTHPYVRIRDMYQNKRIELNKDFLYVDDNTFTGICRYIVSTNDVIISIVGNTIGLVSIIGKSLNNASLTENCVKLVDLNNCSSEFLYYILTSDYGQSEIEKRIIGTSQPKLPIYNIQDINITLPPLPEQRAIAEVLSSLDDKIDLLTRQNTTLEALAQTYFRQWFSEGEKTMTVSDVADLMCVNVNPLLNPLEPFYHYSIPAYDNGKTPTIELGKEILSNKYMVQPNSILISKLNPITPRVWLIGDAVTNNSVCSTEFQVLLPKDCKHQLYLYCLMNSYEVVQDFAQSATGTSGSHQRIRPEQIVKTEAIEPDDLQLDNFNELCLPMFDKMSKNSAQINTLQKLRDTLLPKLISGEIRVRI